MHRDGTVFGQTSLAIQWCSSTASSLLNWETVEQKEAEDIKQVLAQEKELV